MTRKPYDLSLCRQQFPALDLKVNGHKAIFFDGPGGTQVPRRVVERMEKYLFFENANLHGPFLTSLATDKALDAGREAMADMLGCRPEEIAFGQNMTTLNFSLSRALAKQLKPGDEIVITDLDHEGNRGPWLALEDLGFTVQSALVDPETLTLDMDDLRSKITQKTRIVAVSGASNATGTISDVKHIAGWAREVGAYCIVDGVHLVPDRAVDLKDLGCDFLLCSAYKFFGPHVGVLYGRYEAFEKLDTFKLIPQSDEVPWRMETGTLNFEGIAGLVEAVEFIADIGRSWHKAKGDQRQAEGDWPQTEGPGRQAEGNRRRAILAGMEAIDEHEQALAARLLEGLRDIDGLKAYGPPTGHPRTPTISFTLEGRTAGSIAQSLAERGIFAWAGDFYATTLVQKLGLNRTGGLLRMGLAPYNTAEEVARVVEVMREIAEEC